MVPSFQMSVMTPMETTGLQRESQCDSSGVVPQHQDAFRSDTGRAKTGRSETDRAGTAAAFAAILCADPSRPFVVAQLGQSLDGRIATDTGESRDISGSCALDHLHALRAHVDAVVVGVGTVVADNPQLTVRRVPGRNPARVVLDPRGRVPLDARCVQSGDTPRYIVRATDSAAIDGPTPDGVEALHLDADANGQIPPAEIVAALFARGLRRILVEGGADTISRFLDAGCVDRFHVMVAPVIIGSGKPSLEMTPISALDKALRPAADVYVLPDGNVLFDCDLRPATP
ncbi:MAG TPA: RibD family protein [Alphaproteobacteria bacterium]|nr:RibD family protein [Alphaproteobacteria bacterium]